jgi:hypothetical protein
MRGPYSGTPYCTATLIRRKKEINLYLVRARRFVRKSTSSAEKGLSNAGDNAANDAIERKLPSTYAFHLISKAHHGLFV